MSEKVEPVSLSSLVPGEHGTVESIVMKHIGVRKRLLEMGLIKGTRVEFVRSAPMGDPIEIRVGSYRLSLRRVEAEAVLVQKEAP